MKNPKKNAALAHRGHYHHGDLPGALKTAAVALIARRGVEGFSLREAAVAVKVAPSAAYRHFANKDELLGAVAEDAFSDLAESIRSSVDAVTARPGSAKSATERFKAMGRAYVRFALAQPARFQAMYGLAVSCAARRNAQKQPDITGGATDHSHSAAYTMLMLLLDDLCAADVIGKKGRAQAEVTAWSAIHGLAHLLVTGMLPAPTDDAADTLSDQIMLRVITSLKQ